jgi:hypothetical protein
MGIHPAVLIYVVKFYFQYFKNAGRPPQVAMYILYIFAVLRAILNFTLGPQG